MAWAPPKIKISGGSLQYSKLSQPELPFQTQPNTEASLYRQWNLLHVGG